MKNKTTFLLVTVFAAFMLWLLTAGAQAQSPLATLASSMKPGEWKSFTPVNWDGSQNPPCQDNSTGACFQSGILSPRHLHPSVSISDYITQYSDSAAWSRGKLSFLGQTHGSAYAGGFLQYDEATNRFSYGPWITGDCNQVVVNGIGCFNHGYDHSTADPVSGDFYYHRAGSREIWRFPYGASAFIRLPDVPTQSYNFDGAFKFVPGIGLIFIDTDWGVWRCAMPCATAASWTLIANSSVVLNAALPSVGRMATAWADYSAPAKTLVFGSGTAVWTMNLAGEFVNRAPAPVYLGINNSLQTVDPVTGHVLALVGATMYQFDIAANQWTQVATTIPFTNPGDGTVEASIPEYGVSIFLKYVMGGGPVWLYKHSGSGQPLPPPVEAPPIPPPPTPADWLTRSTAPGVVKAVGFDQASDIAGRYGDNSGLFPGAQTTATLDTAVKASGASSLKFVIPTNSGSDASGAYFTNFSQDLSVQFGAGETFYYQWREYLSPEMVNTVFNGSGGWKQSIVGTGDRPATIATSSCTPLELVVNKYATFAFPVLYNSCTGSTSHGSYDGLYEALPGGVYKLQNAIPNCMTTDTSGCFKYAANEWMTFQVGVYIGQRVGNEWPNSWVRMWIAREGQPSQLVVNHGPYALSGGAAEDKFGKIWLLKYMTGKDATQAHPVATANYDELIISRNRIADPPLTGTTPPPPVNAAPTVAPISNQSLTLPGNAVFAATVADDGLPSNTLTYHWTGTGVTFGTPNAATTTATAAVGSYSITFTASDGALETQRAAILTVSAAPAGDTVAPVVTFKTLNNSTFSSNTKVIEFLASDNIGVVLCVPTVNGIAVQPVPIFTPGAKLPATIKFYLQQASIPRATYVLGVSCRDAAGNEGTAPSISVIRK